MTKATSAARRAAIGAACGVVFGMPLPAAAHAYDVGALHIGHPWTRPTPNGASTALGYLTVTNHGTSPERLLGGASPVSATLTAHTMSMSGGVMRMRALPGGYPIAPGATLTLGPGADHLMFEGLKRPFKLGERIPATLRFARAGSVKVEFVVQADAPAAGEAMPHMDMK
jgi:copper(I)-binding protein